MNKKGMTQIVLIFIIGFILLALFIIRNQLGIYSSPNIKDKFAMIDCGNDNFCGSPDDLNSDDTLIFEESHKTEPVLQLVPADLCIQRDPNGYVGCSSSGSIRRAIVNSTLKIDGVTVDSSYRLQANNRQSIDRKAEVFYTWQIPYNNEGRYSYDASSGNYFGFPYPNWEGYRLCLEAGYCVKEHLSLVFRVEPGGQGASTTIPITSSTSTILKPGETTVQETTTTTIHEDIKEISLFDRIRFFFKRLFSRLTL